MECNPTIYKEKFDDMVIHHWFNITNIIPHSPDDGSLEPKRYSVDFASQ